MDLEEEKRQLETQRQEKEKIARDRKIKMRELEKRALKLVKKSDEEIAQQARDDFIRGEASAKRDSESDVVKLLSSMAARASAFTIRDKQLEEKKQREHVEEEYERRMDILMELDRVKEIQAREAAEHAKVRLHHTHLTTKYHIHATLYHTHTTTLYHTHLTMLYQPHVAMLYQPHPRRDALLHHSICHVCPHCCLTSSHLISLHLKSPQITPSHPTPPPGTQTPPRPTNHHRPNPRTRTTKTLHLGSQGTRKHGDEADHEEVRGRGPGQSRATAGGGGQKSTRSGERKCCGD